MLIGCRNIGADLQYYKNLKALKVPAVPSPIPNPWNKHLPIEQAKCRHYWIWSKYPNAGKTTKFLNPLADKYSATYYNQSEKFQSFNVNTSAVLIDEYTKASLTAT